MSGFFGGGGTAPSNLVGATSSAAGTAGLVPAPAQRNQFTCLAGDATFKPALIRPNITAFASTRLYAPVGARSDNGITTYPSFASTAYCTPIFLKAGTIDALSIKLGNQFTNSTNYVALYDSDSDGKPSTLLTASTGNSFTTTATTDDNAQKTVVLTSTLSINAGLYYTALFGSANNNQFRGVVQSAESSHTFFFGVDLSGSTLNFVNFPFVISISSSTFPSSASPTISNQAMPCIFVRYQ
jgi:hypothetical protein